MTLLSIVNSVSYSISLPSCAAATLSLPSPTLIVCFVTVIKSLTLFEATAAGCATAKRIFAFTRFGATLVGAVATGLVERSVLLSFLTNSFNFSGLFLSSSFDTFTGSFGLVASVT